jgi:hypothetical protein
MYEYSLDPFVVLSYFLSSQLTVGTGLSILLVVPRYHISSLLA